MRNISFAMTPDQILNRSKTVTRRLGWRFLTPGDLLQPVRKCRGLKKGERVEPLGCPIRVLSVKGEPLSRLTQSLAYGFRETKLEGFGNFRTLSWPSAFVHWFCDTHRGCVPDTVVTRIEFEYVPQSTDYLRIDP